MKAYDFEFDGRSLQSFGMIICSFGGKGLETISNGANVVFNTVPTQNGARHNLVSASYEDCLEATIQICKHVCGGNVDTEISSTEFRELTKWLCRKAFLKLKLLDEDHIDIYYEAKIDVNRIELDGKVVGLELNITTNSPFAYKEPRIITIKNLAQNGKYSINDTSYEEGYIYPYTEIVVGEDGDLDIYNAIEDRHTYIANCIAEEVITMDYPIITSSNIEHNKTIQNDFNWNFFRVANTFNNSRNDLTISIPCTIKIKYSPIVKVGL